MERRPSAQSGGGPAAGSSDDVRQHIINSLFWKKDASGTPEETLISFVKVFEDEGGEELKSRYLMLAVTKLGKCVMHKAKRNANLSFSKGKTWNLEDMRGLEVMGPTDFAVTMTVRRYHWQTERAREQQHFVNALVKVYKSYTKTEVPNLVGYTPPATGTATPTTGHPPANDLGRVPSTASGVPSSAAATSPPRTDHMELRPPNFPKTARSASSSSMASQHSAASSTYPMSDYSSSRRGMPSSASVPMSMHHPQQHAQQFEDARTPTASSTAFGRSPLAESSFPPPPHLRSASASGSTHSGHAGASGGIPISSAAGQGMERRPSASNGLGTSPSMNMARSSSGSGLSAAAAATSRKEPGDRGGSHGLSRSPNSSSAGLSVPGQLGAQQSASPTPSAATSKRDDETPPRRPARQAAPPAPIDSSLTPTITTTLPSPAVPPAAQMPPMPPVPDTDSTTQRRPGQRRKSFHPQPLNTAFSREVLLTSKSGILPGAGLVLDDTDPDAIMTNVEEMLEGFDWTASAGAAGGVGLGLGDGIKKKGADAIESRLLDELAALDSANIHAFLESDDRIEQVLGHIDEALNELDEIDMQITGYRVQLNAVSDDISFIESQNRGLQVQTSNQQALLNELKQLLQTVEVPAEDLRVLQQESPGSQRGVQALEQAATSLYKALQAGLDSANAEVAATIARMREYQENSAQFCKRVSDYLEISFKHQSDTTLAEHRKSGKTGTLAEHARMYENLMVYEGLVLYLKEMDEDRYQRLCSNYMGAISQLHQSEMKDLLMGLMRDVNSAGEPNDASFVAAMKSDAARPGGALAKSRAAMGFGLTKDNKPVEKKPAQVEPVAEYYQKALMEIINAVVSEEDFINAFLHLTDMESTFADHMELDSYFRRQAARHAQKSMSPGMVQLVRSMMDLVFGFVDGELRQWIEAGTKRNPINLVGIIAVTERLQREAEQESTSLFFAQMFDKLLARQRAALDLYTTEQLRAIDAAKAGKRRKGVAAFVRHLPVFVERIEAQMEGNDDLLIRAKVDQIYDKLLNAILATLQQIAKTDRAEGQAAEDKGQLNYHVILIENTHQLAEDLAHQPKLAAFQSRVQGMYDDNLSGYNKLLIRRSFGRIMDFFDGVERQMRSSPANEVSLHQNFSRSALKKLLKDYTAKDFRKAIEAMSRRVEKHFGDDETEDGGGGGGSGSGGLGAAMIATVWRAVTEELKREIQRNEGLIKACYEGSGLGLELGAADVEAACRKVRA